MTTPTALQVAIRNPWIRRVLWSALALLLIWALAWLVVPPLLKHQLIKAASSQIGRGLQIGEIDFKPWTLELTVRDLAVASQDGATTQLAIKRLYANLELESLMRLAPVVNTLTVDGPQLRVRRLASGAYDFDDVLERLAAAAAAKEGKSADPPRFALFNLSVRDGAVDLDDQPVARQHRLRALSLELPFLSNLPARREITVTPQLAFTLNDSRFDSRASTIPFAPSRKTDAVFRIQAMDLAPYLPYIPSSVPVRLQRAVLDADLQVKFLQEGDAQVVISGQLALTELAMADAAGGELLAFDSLKLVLDEVRPLEQQVKIASAALQGPRLSVTRDENGQINLERMTATAPNGANVSSSTSVAKPEPPKSPAAPAPATTWQVALAELSVRDGVVRWHDAHLAPAAELQADALTLDVRDAVWPMARPLAFKGSLALGMPATQSKPGPTQGPLGKAALRFEGEGTDMQAGVQVNLVQASLGLLEPYLAQFLTPELQGSVNADLALRWKAPELQVAVSALTVDQLALVTRGSGNQARLASVHKLALADAQIDWGGRKVSVASIELTQPQAAIARGADRRWMAEKWLRQPAAAASAPSTGRTGASVAPSDQTGATTVEKPVPVAETVAPWQGRIDAFRLRAGAFSFDDSAIMPAVAFDVSALELELKNLPLDGKQPVPTRLTARVAARKGEAGSIDYRGSVRVDPLQAKGSVQALQIPLQVFEPYFGDQLNIEIARADAGFKGDLDYADNGQGPVARVRGDIVLEDFRANSIASRAGEAQLAQELLNWKALGLRGVDLAMSPGKPVRVAVRETSLSDFFARVIVHENGRINLQDLVRSADPAQLPVSGTAEPGRAQDPTRQGTKAMAASGAGMQGDRQMAVAGPVAAAPAAPNPAAAPDPMAPEIQIGPISLVQGKVYFSDRFVKPNYSANLTELTGKLSAFSSKVVPGQPNMAELELRGRAEGTASLEILGQLNPLAQPLALDIKGRVRDLELPPLSPYAVKYAGHGIERGKLSVDVAYLIKPDGQLTASNQVVLNQLVFGEKVDGAPNSLPVRLAVALLADRNGVIDINLPVSGSLNDPQFRLGPVIFKVIVNLIGKALTAPFTLLASAFGGGGDELSQVAFANGSALLMPASTAGLDKVAKALTDRPSLRMTVVGTANLAIEHDAYQRGRLLELMQAEQRRAGVVRAGAAPVAATSAPAAAASAPVVAASGPAVAASAPVAAAGALAATPQAAELLRQVYLRSEIAKPRDLNGKAKVLPTAEMQALLLANIAVDEEAMRALALQRAVAVKDYLIGQKLPAERLFLGAVKAVEPDAKWSPRAELTLGNQ